MTRWSPDRLREAAAWGMAFCLLAAGLVMAVGCAPASRGTAAAPGVDKADAQASSSLVGDSPVTDPETAKRLAAECGIKVARLSTLADGSLIDMRYYVVDYELARKQMEKEVHLIDSARNAVLATPTVARVGTLRVRRVGPPGKLYYALFQNPGTLGPGAPLTLVIAGRRYEGLVLR